MRKQASKQASKRARKEANGLSCCPLCDTKVECTLMSFLDLNDQRQEDAEQKRAARQEAELLRLPLQAAQRRRHAPIQSQPQLPTATQSTTVFQ